MDHITVYYCGLKPCTKEEYEAAMEEAAKGPFEALKNAHYIKRSYEVADPDDPWLRWEP